MSHLRYLQLNRMLTDVCLDDGSHQPVLPTRVDALVNAEPRVMPPDVSQPKGPAANDELPADRSTEDVLAVLMSMSEQMHALEQRRADALNELQKVAVELALLATSHILHRVVEANEFPIADLVSRAIARLESHRELTVRLHPEDLAALQAFREQHAETTDWAETIKWVGDPALQRGSCLADAGDYGLLSTLEHRMTELRQCFMEGTDDAQAERRGIPTEDQTVRRFPDRRETA